VAITSILDLKLKADALDNAHQVINKTLADTRARPGCIGITVYVDMDDPAHVVLFEHWESVEADRAYRAWRATPEGAATELGAIIAEASLSMYTEAEGV
jgi:heme oxygenase (mycobilin-producing)